jgi:hypothetical protein
MKMKKKMIKLKKKKNKERPKKTQVNTPNSKLIIINDIMVYDNFKKYF